MPPPTTFFLGWPSLKQNLYLEPIPFHRILLSVSEAEKTGKETPAKVTMTDNFVYYHLEGIFAF